MNSDLDIRDGHAHQRRHHPSDRAAEQHEKAKHEEGAGVGDQVVPAAVEQWRGIDLWQSVQLAGVDPVRVQPVPAELVDELG